MVEITRVSKFYPGRDRPALDKLSLHVPRGQFVYLSGPSGAGKTTLIRLLMGAELPNQGTVKVGGADLGRIKPRRIPHFRRRLGVIFQDFKLVGSLSVFENVALSLRVANGGGKGLADRVMKTLAQVGLEGRAWVRADTLSGGEQQRAAVARALVSRPPLILADEPTGNLDPGNARHVVALLAHAHKGGATVVLATHDPALLALIPGARVVRLHQGRLGGGK